MIYKSFIVTTTDNVQLIVHNWLPEPDVQVKAIIQISHGMAEHAARYETMAGYFTNLGFAVYANDHRGHGKTAGKIENIGFFASKNGWFKVVDDLYLVTMKIKDDFPGKPVFLFGHSMGSLIARTFICNYSNQINGLVLSATSGENGLIIDSGIFIAKIIGLIFGKKTPSPFLNNMSFGKFNSYFSPNRTAFDWLSRDKEQVDKYISDPFCGTIFSNSFFKDLLTGVKYNNNKKNLLKIRKDLPVLFISGGLDPVGNFLKGVLKVIDIFKTANLQNVNSVFYPDSRHELVNELNKEEVFNDLYKWIQKNL